MKKLFYFFIDGIGLGSEDKKINPLINLFTPLTGESVCIRSKVPAEFPGGILLPLDACLDVPGIPQSATGQTSLFTGINAQKLLGMHATAIPPEPLKQLIEKHSLMKRLTENGITATCANLYSERFFHEREGGRRNRFPASTLMTRASGSPFRFYSDYQEGMAVFADISNEFIRNRGIELPLISPEEAGERILAIFSETDFVFFEYFMTDIYGHKRNIEQLYKEVERLNRFLYYIQQNADTDTAVLVVSDHGNAEDCSTGYHTKNPVPFLLLSKEKTVLNTAAGLVKNLTDVYDAVLSLFGITASSTEP